MRELRKLGHEGFIFDGVQGILAFQLRSEQREEIFLSHAAAFFGCQCFVGGIGSGFKTCRGVDFFIGSLCGCSQTVVGAQ